MVELKERTTDFAAHLQAAVHAKGDEAARKGALEAFLAVGWPTHKDEEFKYTPLRDLEETVLGLAPRADLSEAEFSALPIAHADGPRLVFVNGVFNPVLSRLEEIDGLTFGPISQVGDQVKLGTIATYEGKLGSTNDPRFVNLNDAVWTEGAALHVARGKAIEVPLQIVYVTVASDAAFMVSPRTILVLEAGAQAKVVETFVGKEGTTFTNAVSEFWIDRDAMLEHNRIQHEAAGTYHIGNVFGHQEANSTYTSTSVQFGAKVGRCDINVYLNGEHTETWLNGTYVGKDEQILTNYTRLDHAMPNCHSFEVYKGILDDKAVGAFNGKIFVYQDAQKTDAKQTNQALLLSPTATINTKPQLEIFADDVKCTHGATVGQLRDDAMFYLRSRGIPEHQARALLVYAFSAEVLEKIGVDEVREYLEAELFAKLGNA